MTENNNNNDAGDGTQDSGKATNNAGNEKLFTQDELNAKISARLEREKTKYADLQQQYEDLQAKIRDAEFESLKKKILASKELPEELAARLKGETEEELAADAEKLAAIVNAKKSVGRNTNPADNGAVLFTVAEVKAMTPEQRIANMVQIEKQLKDGTLK
jgi:hypothetical protein